MDNIVSGDVPELIDTDSDVNNITTDDSTQCHVKHTRKDGAVLKTALSVDADPFIPNNNEHDVDILGVTDNNNSAVPHRQNRSSTGRSKTRKWIRRN